MTRASKLANTLEDGYGLDQWHSQQTAIGLLYEPWILNKIGALPMDEMGARDWKEMAKLCALAMDKAGANEKAKYGSFLHKLTEKLDKGEELPADLSERAVQDLNAYSYYTQTLDHRSIEEFMVCHEVNAAGTPDRISHYSGPGPFGEPFDDDVIVDLKSGRVKAQSWAMQLSTYARSRKYRCLHEAAKPSRELCEARWAEHEYEDVKVNQDWGIVVNIQDAEDGMVHPLQWVDLKIGWRDVQLATDVRLSRRKADRLIPFAGEVN